MIEDNGVLIICIWKVRFNCVPNQATHNLNIDWHFITETVIFTLVQDSNQLSIFHAAINEILN